MKYNYRIIKDTLFPVIPDMSLKLKLLAIFITVAVILTIIIRPYYIFTDKTLNISPLKTLLGRSSLITYNNQVNILLLGIAGDNHDGPNLSDSIIVANYNFVTNKITTISIPRDIWSNTLKDKINSAYAYGEAKKPKKGGFILARAEVSAIIGLPIQYAAVIDFDKFKELIDFLGGITVDVENSFTDEKFPVTGKENDNCNGDKELKCRYETISFTKGKTTMNGETSLKFVRSRNAVGNEGTDFAREKRQQKLIDGVKDALIKKVLKPDLENYTKLYDLLNHLVKRDVTNQQLAFIAKNIIFKGNLLQRKIALGENFFINPPLGDPDYNGLWVLAPKSGNFDLIHNYIACQLSDEEKCKQN